MVEYLKNQFMRKILFFTVLLVFSFVSRAAAPQSKLPFPYFNECTVTVSYTASASGTDCDGNPFTVNSTQSSTATSGTGDCLAAYAVAQRNARNLATSTAVAAVSIIEASCENGPQS